MASRTGIAVLLLCAISCTQASFESSDSATAAGSGFLKRLWDNYGQNLNLGSVSDNLGSVGSGDYGSNGQKGNYPPATSNGWGPANYGTNYGNNRANYSPRTPSRPIDLPETDYPRTYPDNSRSASDYPMDYNRGRQDYIPSRSRPAQTQPQPQPQPNNAKARGRTAGGERVSTERSGRNRFPDPTRIYDNVERETMVFLRVAPVLSQSTRNTPWEVIEGIFHGPWSWEWAAQHVYALHWDLEYRFDAHGDTIFTFGSRKENDGKLWPSLDKRAFTEMPAKYFFLGNITTSPKAAVQAAADNSLNGQLYDVIMVNCQTWAIQHCKDMSEDLYLRMKNFPTLLESTKYAALWAQSVLTAAFTGEELKAPPPPIRSDPNQLW